jgi:hypothetical protein
MAPRKDFVVPKSQSGLSAPNATSTGGTPIEVGEGTKVLDLPFDMDQLTAPGHRPHTVKEMAKGSSRLNKGIFK